MRNWLYGLLLVLLSLTLGCGSSDSVATGSGGDLRSGSAVLPAGTLIGRVEGTPLLVAVSADAKRVLVYLCDGTLAQRFDGDLANGRADLTSATGDRLSIFIEGDAATGTVVLAGVNRSFTAQRGPAGSALLWASGDIEGQSLVGGWISLDGKNEVGVVAKPTSFSLTAPVPQPGSSIIAILIGLRLPVVGPATTAGGAPQLGVVSSDSFKELR